MKVLNFKSLNEFNAYCKGADTAPQYARYNTGSRDGNSTFTGTETFEQAATLMETGAADIVEKLKAAVPAFKQAKSPARFKQINAVIGYAPHVANTLAGVPESMIGARRNTVKQKIVNICYSSTFSCGVSTEEIINTGAALLAALEGLEKSGYRVNLSVGCFVDMNREQYGVTVKVKDSNEYFNLARLSYAIAHPSFLRRHIFKCMEAETDKKYFHSGHGCVIYREATVQKMAPAGSLCIIGEKYIREPETISETIKTYITGLK